MTEFTITFIIALTALCVITFLLFVIYITIGISRDLKLQNEDKIYEIESLKNELRLQKNISETYKKGLTTKN